jgi:hypothetical protein
MQLPNELLEFMTERLNRSPPPDLVAHLRQEQFHAVWSTILNEEFVAAHKNGVLVTCADKIQRRLYPRVMTYSTDYPER